MDKSNIQTIHDIEEVISKLKYDEKVVLDDLFGYYYQQSFHFSKSILKIESVIDVVLQEVFVKLWLTRQKIGNAEPFNSNIITITKNQVLNLM